MASLRSRQHKSVHPARRLKQSLLLSIGCLTTCIGASLLGTAEAEEYHAVQRDTFGEVGLLEMPSAEMAPDGQLSITLSGLAGTQRGTLGFQVLPWLEGSFRYSRLNHWVASGPYYDRSFGLKARLFQETRYTPTISVGIRDLIGTGVYGAEYIVASKKIWDFDFTAGLGWGRLASNGTLRNPFGLISQKFYVRARPTGLGGKIDLTQFFRGPDTGIFGGVVWHTPIDNLDLSVEYSSDRYLRESRAGGFKVDLPINAGLTYTPVQGVTLTGGWFYNKTAALTLTVSLDPTHSSAATKIDTAPMAPVLRTDGEQTAAITALVNGTPGKSLPQPVQSAQADNALGQLVSGLGLASNAEVDGRMLLVDVHAGGRGHKYCMQYANAAEASNAGIDSVAVTDLDNETGAVALCDVRHRADRGGMVRTAYAYSAPAQDSPTDYNTAEQQIRADAAAQSLRIEAIGFGANEVTVYYRNTHYEFESEALGRLVRVLMADAPPDIEIFRMLPVRGGVVMHDVQVLRAPLERLYTTRGTTADMRAAISLRSAPLSNPILDRGESGTYPRFSWSISPSARQGLFDPSSPLRVQVFAAIAGGIEFFPGLSLEAQYEANIYSTFVAQPSNSVLPHVRSDVGFYLTKGANGISALDLTYRARVAPEVFVEARAGYLEDMFAGAGAQILWRPEDGRWALGADLYEVWQRNFDRLAGLQDYHVLTGHVSIYYQSPWHGINVNVHAGRYLAGDDGLTIELSRRFSTGIEVGAFATFTNVPFSTFGEGSFDKGITVRIPLDWGLPFSTQSSYNVTLRPLTRDGGQRLAGDDSLYEETRRTSYDEISQNNDYIANP